MLDVYRCGEVAMPTKFAAPVPAPWSCRRLFAERVLRFSPLIIASGSADGCPAVYPNPTLSTASSWIARPDGETLDYSSPFLSEPLHNFTLAESIWIR